jgi:hypothetical protein
MPLPDVFYTQMAVLFEINLYGGSKVKKLLVIKYVLN